MNVRPLDVPPPGVGENTVTVAVPALTTSDAEIVPRNSVDETNVVVRFDPFHRTTEPETKFVPITVSVKPGLPADVDEGLSEVVVGAGLEALTRKFRVFDVP